MNVYIWQEAVVGIFHNPSLWLISITDWTDLITISDKNLWASNVYNYWDTLSESNCGKFYQRWNNYWFPFTWATTKSSSQVNAQNYWPWNYYNSSTFITVNYWDSSSNTNLRWGTTWTNEAMKWPCSSWYHIPKSSELKSLKDVWINIWAWTSTWVTNFSQYLKAPLSWNLFSWNGTHVSNWTSWYFWSSERASYAYAQYFISSWISDWNSGYQSAIWLPIRPFANIPVEPDNTWTILYQP